jgi:hypothetical protein
MESSSLFYQTPLINRSSLPTNFNSSVSSDSSNSHHDSIYGQDHHNGMVAIITTVCTAKVILTLWGAVSIMAGTVRTAITKVTSVGS